MREDLLERLAAVEGRLAANGDIQSDADARTVSEAIAAIRQPTGVKVKPLEWAAIDGGNAFRAPALIFGWIRIETYTLHNWQVQWSVPGICNLLMPNVFKSPDEAKAAAQADYERRILSALEATPSALATGGTDAE